MLCITADGLVEYRLQIWRSALPYNTSSQSQSGGISPYVTRSTAPTLNGFWQERPAAVGLILEAAVNSFSRNLKIEVVEEAASQEPPCHLSPFLFSSIAQEKYLFYYKSGDQE